MTAVPSFFTNRETLDAAQMVDLSFPYAGASIWHPYGYQLESAILDEAARLLDAQGFEELGLPSLIPVTIFQRQADAIKDFLARTYLATPIPDQDFVLKPTIEAQISVLMATQTNSSSRYYTRRGVARYEQGKTFPLWKERIVWPFFEAHAAVPRAAVNSEITRLIEFTQSLAHAIGLPILTIERLVIDGARHLTYAHRRLEAVHIMRDGRVTALTSIYDLGDRFSRAFGVRGTDGSWLDMVNFGFSGRMLLALLTYLSETAGWMFPVRIAPRHVALIVVRGDVQSQEHAKNLAAMFTAQGISPEMIIARNESAGLQQAVIMGLFIRIVVTCSANQLQMRLVPVDETDVALSDEASLGSVVAALLDKNERRRAALYESYHTTVLQQATDESIMHQLLAEERAMSIALCAEENCLVAVHHIAQQAGSALIGQIIRELGGEPVCALCQRTAVQEILVAQRFSQEK